MVNRPAHTLPELAIEGKLIIGHAQNIMMEGTNRDYYAQSRQQQQPEQNADHLPECQEAVHVLAKSNNAPETGWQPSWAQNSATQKQLGMIIT